MWVGEVGYVRVTEGEPDNFVQKSNGLKDGSLSAVIVAH